MFQDIIHKIRTCDYEQLLQHDQLVKTQNRKEAFYGFGTNNFFLFNIFDDLLISFKISLLCCYQIYVQLLDLWAL